MDQMEKQAALSTMSSNSQTQNHDSITDIFVRAKIIWGAKWTSHYDDDSLEMAMHEWMNAVGSISPILINLALDQCALTMPWPPSIAEFLDVCDDISGMPNSSKVMQDAIRQDFSHSLTKAIYEEVGSWAFRNDSEKDLLKKIDQARAKIIKEQRLSRKGIEDGTSRTYF